MDSCSECRETENVSAFKRGDFYSLNRLVDSKSHIWCRQSLQVLIESKSVILELWIDAILIVPSINGAPFSQFPFNYNLVYLCAIFLSRNRC